MVPMRASWLYFREVGNHGHPIAARIAGSLDGGSNAHEVLPRILRQVLPVLNGNQVQDLIAQVEAYIRMGITTESWDGVCGAVQAALDGVLKVRDNIPCEPSANYLHCVEAWHRFNVSYEGRRLCPCGCEG